MKVISLIIISCLLFSCSITSKQHEADADADLKIGWLHGDCLAIKNANIQHSTKFTIFDFEAEHQLISASIIGKAQSDEDCYALLEDRKSVNISEGYSFYKVKSERSINLAIGFLHLRAPKDLIFNYCTTTEGVSFSVFKQKIKIWEGYYYLGYESEATCEE